MTQAHHVSKLILLMLLLCCSTRYSTALSVDASTSNNNNSRKQPNTPAVTISVCTGPDCRVDGSSDCMKILQKSLSGVDKSSIRVTGRGCVGPCGDGPCAFILEGNDQTKKIVQKQPSKEQIALVAPDVFASNPQGWYQMRNRAQIQEVLDIACNEVANKQGDGSEKEDFVSIQAVSSAQIQSTRMWYDRPRNERKVLERLFQVCIALGLSTYNDSHGEIGNLQYGIAAFLWFLSSFIMKENIWNSLIFRKR